MALLLSGCLRLGLSPFADDGGQPDGTGADGGSGGDADADVDVDRDAEVDSGAGRGDGDGDADADGDAGGDADRGADGGADAETAVDADVPGDWHDPEWRSRVAIEVDNSAHPTTELTDFPILVTLEPARFDYGRAAPDGADLLFVDPDTGDRLPREIEEWSPGGTSSVWVLVPVIGAGAVEVGVMLYYANPGASIADEPDLVWANGYAAVYHLNDDLRDSTASGNHGTNGGSTRTAGQVAGGRHFSYADAQHVVIGNTGLPFGSTPRTICAWTTTDALDTTNKHWFISYGTFTNRGGFFIGRVGAELWCGGVGDDVIAADVFSIGEWRYLCCARDGNRVTLYADGSVVEGPATRFWSLTADEAYIGAHINTEWVEQWDGDIDEVRISEVARPEEWLSAEHLSMTSALVTLGASEHLD